MANAQVLIANASNETAASSAWVDTAILAAASFTANKTYLIVAHIISTFSTANGEARARLVHGTTPTVFDDASLAHEGLANTQEHQECWKFFFTQPGTTEDVKIQISSSGTATHTNRIAQILALKLSDDFTENTDYFKAEDLVDYTMTATPTAKATTGSFTPNGTDRWMFIGHQIYDVVGITTPIGFELYDSVAGVLNSCQAEGEDGTNDFRGDTIYWVGVPTNSARTLAVRPFNSGSSIMLASRVFAINLAKFAQSAGTFDATGVDPATTPTYTTLATLSPNPTATGNWVIIGGSNQNVNETATDWETRMQVDASGGGLANSPSVTNYPATAPSIDNWDATDEIPHIILNLVSLTSGGARTINWDCRQVAGTTGRMEDNFLVAFSVALADLTTTIAPDSIGSSEGWESVTVIGPQTVSPTSFGSDEAWGILQANFTLFPNVIGSNEAFGTLTILQFITPNSFGSDEAWGSPQANFSLFPNTIASNEAWESPTVTIVGAGTITPDSFGGDEAWGTHQVNFTLFPDVIGSDEVFGSLSLNHILFPNSFGSDEAWGAPQVNFIVFPNSFGTNEAFGSPQVNFILFPNSFGADEAWGSPIVQAAQTILVDSIDSDEAWGVLAILGLGGEVIFVSVRYLGIRGKYRNKWHDWRMMQ